MTQEIEENKPHIFTKAELLILVDDMIKKTEELPKEAFWMPVTHYDLLSVLMLLQASLRADA